jgi:hypothetical protein
MLSFKNQLLQTFGIETNYIAIVNTDIQIQNANESEPFAEIYTDRNGHTALRVGKLVPTKKIPIVKIR